MNKKIAELRSDKFQAVFDEKLPDNAFDPEFMSDAMLSMRCENKDRGNGRRFRKNLTKIYGKTK